MAATSKPGISSGLADWFAGHFIQPTRLPKPVAFATIFGLVLAIGIVDYLSGIRISLAVFYLVPIALAVAWLGRAQAIAVALVSVVVRLTGDSLSVWPQVLPFSTWWNALSAALVFVFIVWIFSNLLTLYRQLELRVIERTAALRDAAQAQRQLEQELLAIGARERNAIGQELHDDICQHLVGTALAAKVLAQHLADQDAPAAADAQAIVGWLEEGANKSRRLARGLLLSSIDPELLPDKLAELADEGSRSGVSCRFRQDGDILVADAATAAQLFRIAQEALRNALRHAAPRNIDISLQGDAHAICLMVEDDGRGLPPPAERGSGMGLRIMSSRAQYIGGALSLVPVAGQGTRVICHLPRGAAA